MNQVRTSKDDRSSQRPVGLLLSFLQAKTEPEKVRKNRAFVMLAKYWLEQSEGRKELEKYGHWIENAYREPELSEEQLYGKELSGSVTRLERFAACPYQYFCIYGLELREREEYKIRPIDLGNLFHKALFFGFIIYIPTIVVPVAPTCVFLWVIQGDIFISQCKYPENIVFSFALT